MTEAIEILSQAWKDRDGFPIFTTVNSAKSPNSVYVGDIIFDAKIGFVVADNYFDKTRRNIKTGSRGSILFITKERKSYQAKGSISYYKQGPIFDHMQTWRTLKHPGVAATVIEVEELYSGATRLA